jgi:hypothetical protein
MEFPWFVSASRLGRTLRGASRVLLFVSIVSVAFFAGILSTPRIASHKSNVKKAGTSLFYACADSGLVYSQGAMIRKSVLLRCEAGKWVASRAERQLPEEAR